MRTASQCSVELRVHGVLANKTQHVCVFVIVVVSEYPAKWSDLHFSFLWKDPRSTLYAVVYTESLRAVSTSI